MKTKDNNYENFTHRKKGCKAKFINSVMSNLVVGKMTFFYHDRIPDEPSVFVPNHGRVKGPLSMQYRYPDHIRTWSNYKFSDKADCTDHFKNSVLKDLKGEKFYKILLPIAVPIINWYYKTHLNSIPVYQDMRIIKTFKQSIETLENGVHLAIYPEIKETIKNEVISFFKSGFSHLAYHYHRQTNKLLNFYPVYVSQSLKQVHCGKPITYNPNIPMKQQAETIKDYLETNITKLARSLPPHKIITIYGEYKVHSNETSTQNSTDDEK